MSVHGATLEGRWRSTHALATALRAQHYPAIVDMMPTYETILVEFDCVFAHPADVDRTIRAVAASTSPQASGHKNFRRFSVPVRYGGTHGPDLADLAEELALTPADIVARHANRWHRIRCIGSPAGAPMTDGPDLPNSVRRLSVPRTHVPESTVAVAGRQATIYATPAPGGWRLIGRTPLRLFDITKNPPIPYKPGDEIRFFAISDEDWSRYERQPLEVTDERDT